MYYIGVHSTHNADDGYMGSGTLIKKAIKEHGIENFEREVLHVFNTKEEAYKKEEELVSINTLKDSMCYNLVIGGNNGVVSIKEKRAFFSKKAPKLKTKKFAKFRDDVYFEFSVIRDFKLKYDRFSFLDEVMSPTHIMDVVNKLYNNSFTNKDGVKFLNFLKTRIGYKDNITVKGIEWQDQHYIQGN